MNYWKEHKRSILLSMVVTLLPILAGLALWNRLPEQIPIHFGPSGEADSWSSKAYAVFFMPLVMVAIQIFCIFMTNWDPKKKNIHRKNFGVVIWTIPVISLLVAVVTYGTAMGVPIDVNFLMMLVMGVVFFLIGNYLPKCKQNYTMGIKLPWTLHDEANWDYTHRLAGKVWSVGGCAIILTSFLRNAYVLLAIVLVMVLVPTVASYRYYKANKTEEE